MNLSNEVSEGEVCLDSLQEELMVGQKLVKQLIELMTTSMFNCSEAFVARKCSWLFRPLIDLVDG